MNDYCFEQDIESAVRIAWLCGYMEAKGEILNICDCEDELECVNYIMSEWFKDESMDAWELFERKAKEWSIRRRYNGRKRISD